MAIHFLRGAILLAALPALAAAARQTAPARPDLSGVWQIEQDISMLRTMGGKAPPLLPAAAQAYPLNRTADKPDPVSRCISPGMPRVLYLPYPFEIIQRPKQVTFLFQWNHLFRAIDMRGGALEPNSYPLYFGVSQGRWDGSTLVVETVGLSSATFLDNAGLPSSEMLKVVERYRLLRGGRRLEVRIRIDDPSVFSETWETKAIFRKVTGFEIHEDICLDRLEEGKPAVDAEQFRVTGKAKSW